MKIFNIWAGSDSPFVSSVQIIEKLDSVSLDRCHIFSVGNQLAVYCSIIELGQGDICLR